MSNVKSYRVEKLEDLLDIPPEHLDELMEDLRSYIAVCAPLKRIADIVEPGSMDVTHFTFKPDGKRKATLNIKIKGTNGKEGDK